MKASKLTLRDLFAVVTIVALALGWWLDRSRLVMAAADREAVQRDLRFLAHLLEENQREVVFTPLGGVDYVLHQDGSMLWRRHREHPPGTPNGDLFR
jgi:hypothetical protein